MFNFLRYPVYSIPSGGIDPSSVHHASVPAPPAQRPDARFATRQAEVRRNVEPKVSPPEADSSDQASVTIDSKAISDRDIQPATGQSLTSIKGNQLDKSNQKELKETQNQLLKQADELLKKSNEKKAVTASIGGLKQSVEALKKAQGESPQEALEALKNTEFPPALNVKVTLKSGEKFSLIPPGNELAKQRDLGKLMEKAIAILEQHDKQDFASFDQAAADNNIQDLKDSVKEIDKQIGEEANGVQEFTRLESRQCLLTINVRTRVEDSSVKATHIDGDPMTEQQATGSSPGLPGRTDRTDQSSQEYAEAEQGNDRPVTPEPVTPDPAMQDLIDPTGADNDTFINSRGGAALLDDMDVELTFENPETGGSGQGPSQTLDRMKSPSEEPEVTKNTDLQPESTRQTGDIGEGYSELDGISELFVEPEAQQESVLTSAFVTGEAVPSQVTKDAGGLTPSLVSITDDDALDTTDNASNGNSPPPNEETEVSLDRRSEDALENTGFDDSEQPETASTRSGDNGGYARENMTKGTASTTRSSPAAKSKPEVINKPVDLSRVKSSVSSQINTSRKAKSTDSITKAQRAVDKKTLGVTSTYNERSVIENAFEKLQNNVSNLKASQDIARAARKYISNEVQNSEPFLPSTNPRQSEALSFLGLKNNASERDIRLALLDKASKSAESNSKSRHGNRMKTINSHYDALFAK